MAELRFLQKLSPVWRPIIDPNLPSNVQGLTKVAKERKQLYGHEYMVVDDGEIVFTTAFGPLTVTSDGNLRSFPSMMGNQLPLSRSLLKEMFSALVV